MWLQDITTVFLLIFFNYRQGMSCVCQLVETMYLFFFKIFIIFYYEVQSFRIDYVAEVMLVVQGLRIFIVLIRHFQKLNPSCEAIALAVIKTMVMLQVTLITLKWVDSIAWTWQQIFVIAWILAFVMVIVLVISLCCVIESIVYYVRQKRQAEFIYGTIWIFLMLFGITGPLAALVHLAANFYDSEKVLSTNLRKNILTAQITIAVLIGFNIFFTLAFRKKIKSYLQMVQGILENDEQINNIGGNNMDDAPVEEEGQRRLPHSTQNKPPISQKVNLKFDKVQIPLYLIKLSSSYFEIKYSTVSPRQVETNREQPVHIPSARETYAKIQSGRQSNCRSVMQDRTEKYIRPEIKPIMTESNGKAEQGDNPVQPACYRSDRSSEKDPDVESKVESLVQADLCLICCENQANIVLLPCRHGGICLKCTEDLLSANAECYLCRGEIKQILKLDEIDDLRVVGVTNLMKSNTDQ